MLRLQLLWALTLGANIQAFVIWQTFRVPVNKYSRGRAWTAREEWRGGLSRERIGGRARLLSMRTGRSRASGDVQINGATGESYSVALKRSRRQQDAAAAAAAVGAGVGAGVLSEEEDIEMARIMEEAATWAKANSGGSEGGDMTGSDGDQSIQADGAAMESSVLAASEIEDSGEESQLFYDKYTKVYVPVDGLMVKKSYGFWTWQFFGAIFFQHWIRRMYRKGFNIKKVAMGEISWDHVVTEPDHLLELKAYRCERCGYTLYPARGRHERFFDEVEDFRCPECDAPRSAFYDANDPDDPHNQESTEPGEASESEIAAAGGGGADLSVVDVVEGGEPSEVPEDVAPDSPSLVSLPPAEEAEESSFDSTSSVSTSTDDSTDDGGDDLLDF